MKQWLYTLLFAMVGVVALLFAPAVTTAAVDPISQTFQTTSVYDDGLVPVASDKALTGTAAAAQPSPCFGPIAGLVAAKSEARFVVTESGVAIPVAGRIVIVFSAELSS